MFQVVGLVKANISMMLFRVGSSANVIIHVKESSMHYLLQHDMLYTHIERWKSPPENIKLKYS